MRTTLDIDDSVLAAARSLSADSGMSLGAAVSELARRGLRPRVVDNGFPMFDVAPDTPPMTPDMVRDALDE
ncbi:MAG: antitoxin [Actinomycetota bacterium]|jgi:exoribonuclease II|nr:antitoxin [Actinomycetota bacterium]